MGGSSAVDSTVVFSAPGPTIFSLMASLDAVRKLLYSADESVVTTEPTAAPITDPAMPMLDARNSEVAAARAPAPTCIQVTSLKRSLRPSFMGTSLKSAVA